MACCVREFDVKSFRMDAFAWVWIHVDVRVRRDIDSTLNHCEDISVASCSFDILCCYNCMFGSILLFTLTV
jgi:hypothetical protein